MRCVTKRGHVCDEGWDEETSEIASNRTGFYRHSEITRIPRSIDSMDFQSSDESADRKVRDLRSILERDPSAADLKWSLFVAACNTYRHHTCLMPFPPMYTEREDKDIEALVKNKNYTYKMDQSKINGMVKEFCNNIYLFICIINIGNLY